MKVVVVGAGVLGTSAALHLQHGGADVTLLDVAGPGAGTSSRGAGLVCEGMWHPTSLQLVRRSMALMRELSKQGEEDGHPFRYHEVGSTTLVPPRLVEPLRALVKLQRAEGADVRLLGPDEAARLPRHERVSMEGVAEAAHYPRDGWALPRLYCEILWYALSLEGVRAVTTPARLARDAEGKPQVRAEGGALDADAIVLATGVHTRALLGDVGLDAPLAAYRTQALRYHHADAHRLPILHDAVQGFYLRPSWPGQLVAGNGTTTTPEDVEAWRMAADPAFVEATRKRLHARLPQLASGETTDAWAGLDAATPDRLLLAGRHPAAPGLWLLAGGNGHGFMRAPAAGEALAALILGKRPPVDLAAYDPARFRETWSSPFAIREGFSLEG